jgi:hypothetical protein
VTLDELAQVATRDLAADTGRGLHPEAMLARLHRARRRRTAVVSVAAAAVLAVAVAGVGAAVGRDGATPSPRPPVASEPLPSDPTGDDPCSAPRITCLDSGARLRVDLLDPVVLVVAANFQDSPNVLGKGSVEIYRSDIEAGTGVTVMEGAVPVSNGQGWSRDATAGTTARSMATWLAHRPFLRPATPVRLVVSGHPAWRVRTVLRDGATLRASAGVGPVAPLFTNRYGTRASVAPSLPSEITVLRSPSGHGVVVLWSWTTSGRTSVLAGNRAMVAAISFP